MKRTVLSLPILLFVLVVTSLQPQPAQAQNIWMTDFAGRLSASPPATTDWYDSFKDSSEIEACLHMNSAAPSSELSAELGFSLGSWSSVVREHWESLFLPRLMQCVPFALRRVTEDFMARLTSPGGLGFNLMLFTLTLAITVFGVRLATGGIQNIKGEGTGFILKIAFVIYWALQGHVFVAPLFATMNELIGLVSDAVSIAGMTSLSCPILNFGTGAMTLWYRGDCVLQQMLGVGGSIIEGHPTESSALMSQAGVMAAALFTGGAKGLFLVGLAAIIMLLMFMFKALFYVLYAFVMASFLMVLSVFIMPLMLFQKTSQYFQTWTGLLLSTILQPVVMVAYFALILVLIDFTLTWAPGNRFKILNIPRPQGELMAAMHAEGATGDPQLFMEGRVQRNLAHNQPAFSVSGSVDPQAYRIWEMCTDPNNPKILGTADPDIPGSGAPLLDDYGKPMSFANYNECYIYASESVTGSRMQAIADMMRNPGEALRNSFPLQVSRIFTTGAQEARTAANPDDEFAGRPEDKNLADIFWMLANSFFLLLISGLSLILMKDVEEVAERVGGAAASSVGGGQSLSLSKPGFAQQGGLSGENIQKKAAAGANRAWDTASQAVGNGLRNAFGAGQKATVPRSGPGQTGGGGGMSAGGNQGASSTQPRAKP